jgi:hypothetical protein
MAAVVMLLLALVALACPAHGSAAASAELSLPQADVAAAVSSACTSLRCARRNAAVVRSAESVLDVSVSTALSSSTGVSADNSGGEASGPVETVAPQSQPFLDFKVTLRIITRGAGSIAARC